MAAILAAEPELHSSARMHVPHRTSCFEVRAASCMSVSMYHCQYAFSTASEAILLCRCVQEHSTFSGISMH